MVKSVWRQFEGSVAKFAEGFCDHYLERAEAHWEVDENQDWLSWSIKNPYQLIQKLIVWYFDEIFLERL